MASGSEPPTSPETSPTSLHHPPTHPSRFAPADVNFVPTSASTTGRTSSAGNSLSSRSMRSQANLRDTLASRGSEAPVRTLPTWVNERDDADNDTLPALPPIAHRRPPLHSSHDDQRETTPVTMGPTSGAYGSRWKGFLEGSAYPPGTSHSEKLDHEWLNEQGDLDGPWMAKGSRDLEHAVQAAGPGTLEHESVLAKRKKRQLWYTRFHIMLLNSPMVPLALRGVTWTLALIALALAGSIYHLSNKYSFEQKPSTIMAIVVDSVALVFLIYITYDEYSGKPLGLRSPKAKIRLLMFDLGFIIFNAANLSLAFDTLYDVRWSCRSLSNNPTNEEASEFWDGENSGRTVDPICDRQRALAAFLFLVLCSWVATFMISVFRVVERVSSAVRS